MRDDTVPPRVAGLPLRPATDDDGPALRTLIGSVFAEYPGCVLDPEGIDADLQAWASHLRRRGGFGWVVPVDEGLAACVGVVPHRVQQRRGAELLRLYVAAGYRRRGLGAGLAELVERVARAMWRAERIELWSDTRFTDAHRLYEHLGYVRQPDTRDLDDPSDTTEAHFVKLLLAPHR